MTELERGAELALVSLLSLLFKKEKRKKIDVSCLSINPSRIKIFIAESFYNVKYGSSIITSKVSQCISVMKTETLVFLLTSRQKRELKCKNKLFFWKHQFFLFSLQIIFDGHFNVIIDNPYLT